jgi:RecB family exonuclease
MRSSSVNHDETLGAPVQPASGLLVLSATRIRSFLTCPRQFFLAHVLTVPGRETDSDASVLGHAVHRELYERHHRPDAHDADGIIADDVPSDSFVHARVAAHQKLCPRTTHATYLGGEVDLRWLIRSKNLLVVGRADALWRLPDGTLDLRDYKTGQCPESLDDDLPAHVYLLLAATHLSKPKHVRVSYERLGPNPQVVTIDGTKERVSRTVNTLKDMADQIRRERDFAATPSEASCGNCPFLHLCPHASHHSARPHDAQLRRNDRTPDVFPSD